MALTIASNVLALSASLQAGKASNAVGDTIRRLSSGLRINSARDDAAGLAIASRMRVQVSGLNQARRNAGDGQSMLESASGALDSLSARLQRIRDLSVQGLNGTLSLTDTDAVQAEINANLKEIDRLTQQSTFNGLRLLDGSAGMVNLQVGANDSDKLSVNLGGSGFGVNALGLKDFTIAGLPGTVSGLSVLQGRSTNVMIDSPTTTVHWPAGSASPNLVRDANGTFYVQDVDGAGKPTYQQVGYRPTTDTVTGLSDVALYPSGSPVFLSPAAVASRAIGVPSLLDDTNAPIAGASLVQADDGRYFIRKAGSYYQASLGFGTSGTVTAKAADMTSPLTAADFSTLPATVTQTPPVDPATDTVAFQDASGVSLSASASRLLQRNNGTYVIEVDAGGGNFRYYDAALTMSDDGTTRTMTARAVSTTYQTFTDLPSVSGDSTVTIDPAKVSVNYTDRNGVTYGNVLGLDASGNYVFNLPQSAKTGTLVTAQDGSQYIRTVNGSEDVLIFYPLTFTALTDASTNKTVLNVVEAGEGIRLKQPLDPLATLDRALAAVDAQRSLLGAAQNRLDSITNAQQTTATNLDTARSRIEDADYAVEVSKMTASQIVSQAATAMLAQANQQSQAVLSLLGRN
ncbi:flagellin [Cupriavidus metallidurans]|uniref:flagellin N-terminal helical domain-containing protein n=1 Tax=Cupriavidus TaxID=106589 RepID=UPI000E864238|nr:MULTISPECIES: flagellin [unclassified Cupriavidus]GMG90476.1 flagellin [Cupriavidus sp. TKC]HBO79059.1 flagellin [Cupriavidus sp.]